MKPVSAFVALCLFGLGAQAEGICPTAEHRGHPVRLTFAEGYQEVHRSDGNGLWHIDVYEESERIYEIEVAHGTHMLRFADVFDGAPEYATQTRYDYGMPIAEMPVPVPGGRWQVDVEVSGPDGVRPEPQRQAYGAETEVAIGGCRYRMIPVLIAYDTDDQYVEEVHFLPDLGLGYLVDSHTATDSGAPSEPVKIALD